MKTTDDHVRWRVDPSPVTPTEETPAQAETLTVALQRARLSCAHRDGGMMHECCVKPLSLWEHSYTATDNYEETTEGFWESPLQGNLPRFSKMVQMLEKSDRTRPPLLKYLGCRFYITVMWLANSRGKIVRHPWNASCGFWQNTGKCTVSSAICTQNLHIVQSRKIQHWLGSHCWGSIERPWPSRKGSGSGWNDGVSCPSCIIENKTSI